jgi:hypothetical protein
MKRLTPIAVGTATLCIAMSAAVWAEELLPGQVDFGAFSPPKGGGEFVEVNLPSSLISLGARLVEKDEPDAAQLLTGLKLVRVYVIGVDEDNRAEIQKRAQKLRKDLASKGWERIVTAQQKDQDVGIYLKMADKGAVQGLVAVVMDGDQHAVFVNVVGEIKPEQVALLGDKLHIDPLKKIGRAAEKAEDKPKEKASEKAEE